MPQLPPSAPEGAETLQPQPLVMPPPPPVLKHIEVVATGLGFYDNHRKVEGDRFTVPSIEMTGSWMRCVDPKYEKMRVERLEKKRQKANTAAEE